MFFNTFIGCSIFLITNCSLLYASHLLVRRFLPNAPASVRLVAIGTVFYSFIVLLLQALSPFHAITKTWVTISCLLIAMVSHLLWGTLRNIQSDIEPTRIWMKDGLNSRWAALLIICGFVVLLSFSRALLMPPLSWDCLTYHLPFAALWIKKGTLLLFNAPDQISQNVHFPINGELFASWLLLPFHNDLLVNTMNFPITLLGGISCYAIARELRLTRKEASFVPALICFAPVIYLQITTEYVDNAAFAFCSAAVLFTLRYLRRGYLYDNFLALTAAGILFGLKYSGIPIVGIIFTATTIKTISLFDYSGFLRKSGLIVLGLIILCTLGGRQYIINTLDAGNPLYPFPLKILNHQVFEGSSQVEHVNKWASGFEKWKGLDKFSFFEKEYRKFCYRLLTAGPKFFLFLLLAFISLFSKPAEISRRDWYFLSILWIVPIIIHYTDTSAFFAKRACWLDGSTRFLSSSLALFTIQGLIVIKKLSKHFKKIDFFFLALIAWDLLYINKNHLWEVTVLYPLVVVIVCLALIMLQLAIVRLKRFTSKEGSFFISTGSFRLSTTIAKQWIAYTIGFTLLVTGLYFLQCYRDNTRHLYYREHSDFHGIKGNSINQLLSVKSLMDGWEFLDQPDDKKTIAMTKGWDPPGHNWFFYPLLGRWLQNDIIYISTKYKWRVPVWLHRGVLRGNDSSIWFHNLNAKKVDYILVVMPWPIELTWIKRYEDKFQLMFSNKYCKIFKYTGEGV